LKLTGRAQVLDKLATLRRLAAAEAIKNQVRRPLLL
jgi:hypothetical protein